MRRNMPREALCLLMSAALLLLVGCGGGGTRRGTTRTRAHTGDSSQTEETTEPRVTSLMEEVEPGIAAEQAGVEITVDHAYLTDYTFTESGTTVAVVFYEVTIANNAAESLDAGCLSDTFHGLADGEGYATNRLRSATYIARQFGTAANDFSDPIEPGTTTQGYVYLEYPADFEEVSIVFYPAAGFGDTTICYRVNFTRDELEAAPAPVSPLDGS